MGTVWDCPLVVTTDTTSQKGHSRNGFSLKTRRGRDQGPTSPDQVLLDVPPRHRRAQAAASRVPECPHREEGSSPAIALSPLPPHKARPVSTSLCPPGFTRPEATTAC